MNAVRRTGRSWKYRLNPRRRLCAVPVESLTWRQEAYVEAPPHKAYWYIRRWCVAHGHRQLVSRLNNLYLELAAMKLERAGAQNYGRIPSRWLNPLVHRTVVDASGGAALTRARQRYLKMLAQMGLVRLAYGWVEYVDYSEIADPKTHRPCVTDDASICGQNGDSIHKSSKSARKSLVIYKARKSAKAAVAAAKPRGAGGRFAPRVKTESTPEAAPAVPAPTAGGRAGRSDSILPHGFQSAESSTAIPAPRPCGGAKRPGSRPGTSRKDLGRAVADDFASALSARRQRPMKTPTSSQNRRPQEQKTPGHDAQRRIPTPGVAPAADGPAGAGQPLWKNLEGLMAYYQAHRDEADAVRAAAAAGSADSPTPAPRPRAAGPQAPRGASPVPAPTQPPDRTYRQRDDGVRADPTWLAFGLTTSKHLAPLMRSDLVRAGYNRGTWRAAVGGLLGRAPGTVDNPAGFVHGIMRSLVSGTERDPRSKPGYFAQDGWGAPAKRFACVE